MVRNSFGNRNFVQPMARLSMHSKCLDYFSFKFWAGGEGGEGIFFIFSFFPTCSIQVPQVPMFLACSPKNPQ